MTSHRHLPDPDECKEKGADLIRLTNLLNIAIHNNQTYLQNPGYKPYWVT